MSPRPRLTNDEAIFGAAVRSINQFGPRVTLADVAREAGTSPATLLQRFASKRGLLLALAVFTEHTDTRELEALASATSTSPIERLLALPDCVCRAGATPLEISNGIAVLQMNLADPEFHRCAVRSAEALYETARRLLAAAMQAGELSGAPVDRLARVLIATLHGSLMAWAIERRGAPKTWLRSDVAAVLDPYRKRPASGASDHRCGGLQGVIR